MKTTRKLIAMLAALAILCTLSITALADANPGTITITSADHVSVAGRTFRAYQVLMAENAGEGRYIYSVAPEMKQFYSDRYSISTAKLDFDVQVVEKIAKEADFYGFAAAALAAAKEAGLAPREVTAGQDSDSVMLTDLPMGYYVIEDVTAGGSGPVSALMLDTAGNVTIQIKADKPTLDKRICLTDTNSLIKEGTYSKVHESSIGDKFRYELLVTLPDLSAYAGKPYFCILEDNLDAGLTFDRESVAVSLTQGGEVTKTFAPEEFTVSVTGGKGEPTQAKIVLNLDNYRDAKGGVILVSYNASLNEYSKMGNTGNQNSAVLTYSCNPSLTVEGTLEPTQNDIANHAVETTPAVKTQTFTNKLRVIKKDEKGNQLEDAAFTLQEVSGGPGGKPGTEASRWYTVVLRTVRYDVDRSSGTWLELKNGTYTQTPINDENRDQYVSEDLYDKREIEGKITLAHRQVPISASVGDDGVVDFTGLCCGSYVLKESKAPDGFTPMAEPIEFTLSATKTGDGLQWSVEGDGVQLMEDGTLEVTVVNKSGTQLPATGGMGTTGFYILGSTLMLAAAVVYITRKRMSAEA